MIDLFEEQRETAKESYSQQDAVKSIASQMKEYDGDRDDDGDEHCNISETKSADNPKK